MLAVGSLLASDSAVPCCCACPPPARPPPTFHLPPWWSCQQVGICEHWLQLQHMLSVMGGPDMPPAVTAAMWSRLAGKAAAGTGGCWLENTPLGDGSLTALQCCASPNNSCGAARQMQPMVCVVGSVWVVAGPACQRPGTQAWRAWLLQSPGCWLRTVTFPAPGSASQVLASRPCLSAASAKP